MTDNIQIAIDEFNAQLCKYATVHAYLEFVTVACVADRHGFDVVINGVSFFHIGTFAFSEIPTFAYCTIGIMREFCFKHIKSTAE